MYIKGTYIKPSSIISYDPPTITLQPFSKTVGTESSYTFSVKVFGSDPITYQWYRNTFAIPNATNKDLTLSTIQLSDNAYYYCKIKNNGYVIDSDNGYLTVFSIPYIKTQPQNLTVNATDLVTLSVSAYSVNTSLSYQWYKDNITIGSTGSAYYVLATKSDEGYYYVTVYNEITAINSNTVFLSVYDMLFSV